MTILHLDLESRSACPLDKAGVFNYASHATTDLICAAFAFDDEEPQLWLPGQRAPAQACNHIASGGAVWAHNAVFEHEMINGPGQRHGWPPLTMNQMTCTMALALAMALPAKLELAAAALGVDAQKDREGGAIMLQLAQLRGDGRFWTPAEAPEKFARVYAYCQQDVRAERAIGKRMFALSERERRVWLLDAEINARGVGVDAPAAAEALELVARERKVLDAEMNAVTDGAVGTCESTAALRKWLGAGGVELDSVDKETVAETLAGGWVLSSDQRRALELRVEGGKSTGKLLALLHGVGADGRARGLLQYHGAQPGRWAGRRAQPHNMPRPRDATKQEDIEDVLDRLHRRERGIEGYVRTMYGSPMLMLSDALRGLFIAAPGHVLVGPDFASIEARGLAWLAGQDDKLDRFRVGIDPYKFVAASLFRVPLLSVTTGQRQLGKVGEVACGYQGGEDAIEEGARKAGVKLLKGQALAIRDAFRETHPKIVQYWKDLEAAAISAVRSPGVQFKAGAAGREVTYLLPLGKAGLPTSFLLARLPSGRSICYPFPKIVRRKTPWKEMRDCLQYKSINDRTKRWELGDTYGGKLSQNNTEGICADVLRDAMIRLDDAGEPIVLTVHDEIVLEEPVPFERADLERIETIVAAVPEWAAGLPIAVSTFVGERYRK